MTQEPNPVVSIRDLYFGYCDNPVLEKINLTVKSGEFIGIFGPNGGGKSTLLKLLMGFLKPTFGSVELFGNPPKQNLTRIGYVPQSLKCDQKFPITVFELVLTGCLSELSFWGNYPESSKEKAKKALETVGLMPFAKKSFGDLSGGQQQRALIARALASHPDILLLDEPTANIDADAEKAIYEVIQQIRGKTTILMVTHNLNTIINRADRMLCVHKTLTSLKPEEVCHHFAAGLYHDPLIHIEKEPK